MNKLFAISLRERIILLQQIALDPDHPPLAGTMIVVVLVWVAVDRAIRMDMRVLIAFDPALALATSAGGAHSPSYSTSNALTRIWVPPVIFKGTLPQRGQGS